jgi:hypothetical protein
LKHALLPFAGILLLAACASGPKGPPDGGAAARSGNGEAILAQARKTLTDKGCAQAAPAYRVAAGMGEGFESAQHELGECLIALSGISPAETALFRQEGVFWLTRAAYAGNARAQRALALFYGAADNPVGSPGEALRWAMLYGKNSDSDLFGYQGLPPTFAPGLKAALSPAERAEVDKFVAEFAPITLTPFASARAEPERRGEAAGERPPAGGRPPQRRR